MCSLERPLEHENDVLAVCAVVAHQRFHDLIEAVIQLPLHNLAYLWAEKAEAPSLGSFYRRF